MEAESDILLAHCYVPYGTRKFDFGVHQVVWLLQVQFLKVTRAVFNKYLEGLLDWGVTMLVFGF